MKKAIGFLCILLIFLLSACSGGILSTSVRGAGNVTSDVRDVADIQSVDLATIGDLTITLGQTESLTVEAEANLLPYIETQVINGVLTIRTSSGTNLLPTQPIHYTLTVIGLDALSVSSAGNIDAPALQPTLFSVAISSSGNIHLAGLSADSLEVQISSSGSLTIDTGQVRQQNISISSSGSYNAGNVSSQDATVTIASSGNATIWVTGTLNGQISSSGNVNYYGNPAVSVSTSSSGNAISQGSK
jgi:hypothetical protein